MKKPSKFVKIEIIKGVEGMCISVNDTRICGSKPWGGGKLIGKWIVGSGDLKEAMQEKGETE